MHAEDQCCEAPATLGFGGKSLRPPQPPSIMNELQYKRERLVAQLETVNKAIAMLEEHPEFADFTDMMNNAGRI
jgi:hypothetical protein